MKIEGKVALVTGGASGIGRALVESLLEKGIKLVSIVDIDEKDAKIAIDELTVKFKGGRVRFIRCDVTDEKQMKDAFVQTYEVHESLDIVVNNAGIISRDHLQTFKINALGVLNGTIIANEVMTRRKRTETGVIINTGSIGGFRAYEHVSLGYTASKHAIVGIKRAFHSSCDGFSEDLRAVCVCPGAVKTAILTRSDFLSKNGAAKLQEEQEDAYISMASVVAGYIRAIEDDSLNGCFITAEKEGVLEITEQGRARATLQEK